MDMNSTNQVQQSLFEAIDTIVSKKIENLAYDKTVIAKIIENKDRDKGEYIVNDGTTTFKAQSENTNYSKNARVYVKIPNGDWNKNKLIVGKYTTKEDSYYNFQAPEDIFVDITGNLITENHPLALRANGSIPYVNAELSNSSLLLSNYDYLLLQGDFGSYLDSEVTKGNYGIILRVQTSGAGMLEFTLDSDDMFGNPYTFSALSRQQKLFDISDIEDIGTINNVEVRFYQNDNFYKGKRKVEGIAKDKEDNILEEIPNLAVKNLYVSLGNNIDKYKDVEAFLYSTSSSIYKGYFTEEEKKDFTEEDYKNYNEKLNEINEKDVYLKWIHNNKVYTTKPNDNKIKVHWYRMTLLDGVEDELGGKYWAEEEPTSEPFKFTFTPRPGVQFEEIKAIIEVTEEETENVEIESKKYYKTPPLLFTNNANVPDTASAQLIQGFELNFDENDGYNGIYNIYSEAGTILNKNESFKKRKIVANYNTILTGMTNLDKAERIEWLIPKNNTMIVSPQEGIEYSLLKGDIFLDEDDKYYTIIRYGENIKGIDLESMLEENENEEKPETEKKDTAILLYRIKDTYLSSFGNNTIICNIYKNNQKFTQSITPTFGVQGTSGTDYTLTVNFAPRNLYNGVVLKQAAEGIAIENLEDLKIETHLFDYENKEIENANIELSCNTNGFTINRETNMLSLKSGKYEDLFGSIITAEASIILEEREENTEEEGAEETENILTASEGREVKIKAYLPIALFTSSEYLGYEGSPEIIYNPSGTDPIYYKNQFKVNGLTDTENIIWKIDGVTIEEACYYPRVSENGYLKPLSIYMNDSLERPKPIAISCYEKVTLGEGDNVTEAFKLIFSLPLRIIQYAYSNSLLNAWDGKWLTDTENGIAMATMFGAGKKEEDNTFSGVMMGDTNENENENISSVFKNYYTGIGIYGYNHGVKSFGLNINGQAFFGKAGHGQILMDGNSGTIQSARFLETQKDNTSDMTEEQRETNLRGMKIDLDDGTLESYGEGRASVKIDPSPTGYKKPYFEVKSKAGNSLLFIGPNEYYLQSDNFKEDDKSILVENPEVEDNENAELVPVKFGSGMHFDLKNDKLIGYDFSLNARSGSDNSFISLNSSGKPYFQIHNEDSDTKHEVDLMLVSRNKFLLHSADYQKINNTVTGMEIDVYNGKITTDKLVVNAIHRTEQYETFTNSQILGKEEKSDTDFEENNGTYKEESYKMENVNSDTNYSTIDYYFKINTITNGKVLDINNKFYTDWNGKSFISELYTNEINVGSFKFENASSSIYTINRDFVNGNGGILLRSDRGLKIGKAITVDKSTKVVFGGTGKTYNGWDYGWWLSSNGNAEFYNINARSKISASSITTSGSISASSMSIGGSAVATQTWVEGKKYLTSSSISGFLTRDAANGLYAPKTGASTATGVSGGSVKLKDGTTIKLTYNILAGGYIHYIHLSS